MESSCALYLDKTKMDRDFKANNDHWTIIINYFELYPQLIKTKFENSAGDKAAIQEHWNELVHQLNSLGYGKKSVDKWQVAIGRWKSKVKSKASNLRREMERTGGGPVKLPPLTDLEERLMSLFGWKSITGDGNQEIGLSTPGKNPTKLNVSTEVETNSILELEGKSLPPLHFFQNENARTKVNKGIKKVLTPASCSSLNVENASTNKVEQPREQPRTEENNVKKRSGESLSSRCVKRKVLRNSEKTNRYVTLTQMHKENLSILKEMNSNMKVLADAVRELKECMIHYVEYIMENQL